jgi:hypothetical protein
MSATRSAGVEVAIEGLRRLREDLRTNPDAWQNHSLSDYLEAIEAWLEATKDRAPAQPSWEFVVGLLEVGKIYE